MNIEKISIGKDAPNQVNVIIEVPMNADPLKYEMDKDSGAIFVDRFIATPMYYPCNYGFVPHTLSDDGDPCDVLVVSDFPVVPGAVIAVKPVGVLIMEDEKGMDEKIEVIADAIGSQFGIKSVDIKISLINMLLAQMNIYKMSRPTWIFF